MSRLTEVMKTSPVVPSSLEPHSGRSLERGGVTIHEWLAWQLTCPGRVLGTLHLHDHLSLVHPSYQTPPSQPVAIAVCVCVCVCVCLTLLKLQLALCSHSMMSMTRGRHTNLNSGGSTLTHTHHHPARPLTSVFDEGYLQEWFHEVRDETAFLVSQSVPEGCHVATNTHPHVAIPTYHHTEGSEVRGHRSN